jgi:hypothetical protein
MQASIYAHKIAKQATCRPMYPGVLGNMPNNFGVDTAMKYKNSTIGAACHKMELVSPSTVFLFIPKLRKIDFIYILFRNARSIEYE